MDLAFCLSMMNYGTKTIREDLRKIKGLLAQAETTKARAPEMSSGVIKELCMLLEILGLVEQQFLYPRLNNSTPGAIAVDRADDSRREVMEFVHILRNHNPFSEDFDEQLNEAATTVSGHLEILASQVLPLFEKATSSEFQKADQEIFEFKNERMKDPKYADAQSELVQNPYGGEQKRKTIHKEAS